MEDLKRLNHIAPDQHIDGYNSRKTKKFDNQKAKSYGHLQQNSLKTPHIKYAYGEY